MKLGGSGLNNTHYLGGVMTTSQLKSKGAGKAPDIKKLKWQKIIIPKNLDWRTAAKESGLVGVSAFIEHTAAWLIPHHYFQVEHREAITMYSVKNATDVAKKILAKEKRSSELAKLKNLKDPEVVAACVKLVQEKAIKNAVQTEAKLGTLKKKLEMSTGHRHKEEEAFEQMRRSEHFQSRSFGHNQTTLADEILENQRKLNRSNPELLEYLDLLNDRKDLFEKYEQSFHKGDIIRDHLLNIVSALDNEIRALEVYNLMYKHSR